MLPIAFFMKCRLYLLLFFLYSIPQLSAQVYEVKGEIVSEWGSSLPGAVIRVQNRMVGTLSNWDGTFQIKDTVPIQVLEIRYLGFHPKDVEVKDTSFLLIEMEEDEYFDYPDAYDYFPKKPVSESSPTYYFVPLELYSTPFEPMQGRIAGVKMNRLSGAPGASLSLRIRGHNHITNSNEPLYIINGMEMEGTPSGVLGAMQMAPGFSDPLRYILPANIKTLQILKGPETARYGQRGANGVVLIETKATQNISNHWIYKQSLSMQEISTWPALLDAEAYNSWAEERQLVPPGLLQGQDQNWQQKISRKAFATSHQLTRRGEIFFKPYRLMLSLQGRQGPIKHTSLHHLNLNFSTKLGDRRRALKIYYQGAVDQGNQLPAVGHSMPSLDLLQSAWSMNPTLRDASMPFDFIQNPLRIQEEVLFKSRGMHHLLSLHPSLDGDEWGKLEAVLATEIKSERSQINSPFPLSSDPTVSQNLTQSFQQKRYWASATYKNSFYTGDHNLDLEVDWKSQFQQRYNINGNFLQLAPFGYGDLNFWPNYATPYTYPNISVRAYHASSVEVYYQFQKFLRILAGGRAERLQNAQEFNYLVAEKWRFFPYATLSINPFEWANELKNPHSQFRFSYGEPGWGASRTQAYNVAWDFLFERKRWRWLDQIEGSLEAYRKDVNEVRFALTSNDLGNPVWAGQAVGLIRNEGLELRLKFRPHFRDFNLFMVSELNFAYQRNELLRLDDSTFAASGAFITPFMPAQSSRQLAVGESIGSFALPAFLGLDANGQAILSDARWVGQALPRFIGGFRQRWHYKKWRAEFLLEGAAGFQLLNDMSTAFGRQGGLYEGSNFFPAALENELPLFYEQPFATDQLIEQGDYLRLKNIQLSYTFNFNEEEEYYSKDDGVISFSVQNAFLWTKYSGNDPEIALGPLFGAGQDYFSYPLGRIWTLGLELFF